MKTGRFHVLSGKYNATSPSQPVRVAIVGSGIAGVQAASQLVANGFHNVTVFEALPKLGGRICTHYDQDDDGK